jgi:hypothetical protein
MVRDDGLNDQEGEVMDALVEAVNKYAKLPRQHPDDLNFFVDAIHQCQMILAMRVVRRDHPGWTVKS